MVLQVRCKQAQKGAGRIVHDAVGRDLFLTISIRKRILEEIEIHQVLTSARPWWLPSREQGAEATESGVQIIVQLVKWHQGYVRADLQLLVAREAESEGISAHKLM